MTSAICPVCSRRSCFYNLGSLHLLPVMIQHLVPRSRFEQALGSAEPRLDGSADVCRGRSGNVICLFLVLNANMQPMSAIQPRRDFTPQQALPVL